MIRRYYHTVSGAATLVVALAGALLAGAAPAYVDGIVATVGRDPILHSEIMHELMPMAHALSQTASSEEEFKKQVDELFRQTLEQAIEHHILHREAETMGIVVPEDDVERRLTEARVNYGSLAEFQRALDEAGHTMSEFRDRLRRQMKAISASITKRRQFEREAVVSESDIAQYYEDHQEEFRYEARFRARRIFLQADHASEAREAAHAQMQALKESIEQGADFAALAKEHSDGPEAQAGGLIGWIRPGDLVDPLDSALAALAPGGLSDILDTEFGVHLIKLEDIEREGVLSYEEARNEIEPILRKQRGDERYRQWMSTLRRRSNVRVFL